MRVLRWVSGLYVAAVLVATMTPAPSTTDVPAWGRLGLKILDALGLHTTFPVIEALANVALFVPFGVLGVLLAQRPWAVAAAGGAFSLAIELTQHLIPGRFPTVQDVVLNTAGAALGTLVVVLAARVRRR
ncbi:VanZ family protein [Antribacter gilvus]|uniref:VanZ family protein n=1 Tax=Antribacter gilvus TaxID=2304675 RepID=UPI000F76ACBF|nr:VanZ family protein [Antribacter gilvus]